MGGPPRVTWIVLVALLAAFGVLAWMSWATSAQDGAQIQLPVVKHGSVAEGGAEDAVELPLDYKDKADGGLSLVEARLKEISAGLKGKARPFQVVLRVDRRLPYRCLARALEAVGDAGWSRVSVACKGLKGEELRFLYSLPRVDKGAKPTRAERPYISSAPPDRGDGSGTAPAGPGAADDKTPWFRIRIRPGEDRTGPTIYSLYAGPRGLDTPKADEEPVSNSDNPRSLLQRLRGMPGNIGLLIAPDADIRVQTLMSFCDTVLDSGNTCELLLAKP